MGITVLMALLALSRVASAELVRNGDFEELGEGAPVGWSVFVAPAEGAFGRYEAEGGMDGSGGVMLHTPLPYAEDPLNNWSQVIEGPFSGEELVFRGAIRTREATEAFHLIQAWQRRPGRVLQTASTRQDVPLSGTRDWTTLETRFTPPSGTDFLVLRCVLIGVGSAWFDGCTLRGAGAEGSEEAKVEAPRDVGPGTASRVARPEAEIDALEKQLETLRDTGAGMRGDVERLRETNEGLRQQLEMMREELRQLQENLRTPLPELPEMPVRPDVGETPGDRPPPLRPRLWEETP